MREETGRAGVPIHLIGGLAAQASGNEVKAFVRTTREAGIIGASRLEYRGFDCRRSEARLLVNWNDPGRLLEGPAGK